VIISEGRQSSFRRSQLPHTGLRSSHRVWRALHVRLHGDELVSLRMLGFACSCACACVRVYVSTARYPTIRYATTTFREVGTYQPGRHVSTRIYPCIVDVRVLGKMYIPIFRRRPPRRWRFAPSTCTFGIRSV
jgi:hypothetical protein